MSDMTFNKSQGKLTWGSNSYTAVSGPYGSGPLPSGKYTVEKRNVTNSTSLSASYKDKKTGKAFFIPISPTFTTTRSGFGIHPDGNIAGTLGCIGLKGNDTAKFWARWVDTLMSARPSSLVVK